MMATGTYTTTGPSKPLDSSEIANLIKQVEDLWNEGTEALNREAERVLKNNGTPAEDGYILLIPDVGIAYNPLKLAKHLRVSKFIQDTYIINPRTVLYE